MCFFSYVAPPRKLVNIFHPPEKTETTSLQVLHNHTGDNSVNEYCSVNLNLKLNRIDNFVQEPMKCIFDREYHMENKTSTRINDVPVTGVATTSVGLYIYRIWLMSDAKWGHFGCQEWVESNGSDGRKKRQRYLRVNSLVSSLYDLLAKTNQPKTSRLECNNKRERRQPIIENIHLRNTTN